MSGRCSCGFNSWSRTTCCMSFLSPFSQSFLSTRAKAAKKFFFYAFHTSAVLNILIHVMESCSYLISIFVYSISVNLLACSSASFCQGPPPIIHHYLLACPPSSAPLPLTSPPGRKNEEIITHKHHLWISASVGIITFAPLELQRSQTATQLCHP